MGVWSSSLNSLHSSSYQNSSLCGNRWRGFDQQLLMVVMHVRTNAPQRFDGNRLRGHNGAKAHARGATAAQLRAQIFTDALARKFQQTKIAERLNGRAGAILSQSPFERLHYFVARRFGVHVDEVANYDAADVAQAHLARDLRCGFDIRFYNRVFKVLTAGELAGVHVYNRERFGGLDDDRAAGRQIDLRLHELLQLVVDLVIGKQRAPGVVVFHAIQVLRSEQLQERANLFVFVLVVDKHAVYIGGNEIARRLIDQVHVLMQEGGSGGAFVRFQNAVPHADEHAQIRDEFGLAHAAGCGADNCGHPLGTNALHHGLEPVALVRRFDLAGDAAVFARRHEDQVAARQRNVRAYPRAFESAWLFDDLHEHVVAAVNFVGDGPAAASLRDLDVADIQRGLIDVVDVKERVPAQADIHETRAHAGQYVLDFSFEDRADDFFFALDVNFGEDVVLKYGNPVFPRVARDKNLG